MKQEGWTWKKGSGLHDYYFIKPGVKTVKGSQLGVDYFTFYKDVVDYVELTSGGRAVAQPGPETEAAAVDTANDAATSTDPEQDAQLPSTAGGAVTAFATAAATSPPPPPPLRRCSTKTCGKSAPPGMSLPRGGQSRPQPVGFTQDIGIGPRTDGATTSAESGLWDKYTAGTLAIDCDTYCTVFRGPFVVIRLPYACARVHRI